MAKSNHTYDFFPTEEVFVGREKEQQDFSESLDAIIGRKPPWWSGLLPFLKPKPPADRPKPRAFLYYGEGGFGKSGMLRRCMDIAAEKKFRTVSLDWDEYYVRRSTLPNTSAKMITALFTVLTEPELGIAGYFDEYLKVEKKLEEIADKVERLWKEDASNVIAPAVKLGSAVAATQGLPVPGLVQDFAANTLNTLAKEGRRLIIEQLRQAKKMQREELDLYENNEKALTEALVEGLAKAAQVKPILLAIDTYERVDSGAEPYTTETGQSFPKGNYKADVWKVTSTVSHPLPGGFTVDHFWPRHSACTTFDLYTTVSGQNRLIPVEKDAIVGTPTGSSAVVTGYVYLLKDNNCVDRGWIPATKEDARLTYSLIGCDPTTATAEVWSDAFRIYPNPANDVLNIDFAGTPVPPGSRLLVMDFSGRILKTVNLAAQGELQTIQIGNLPQGVFICQIQMEGKVFSIKFVKL